MIFPIENKYFQESADTADDARRMLVLANRILACEGVFDAFGHISVRNPENPQSFFISRAISPEFVTMDDIMLLDLDGNILEGREGFKPFSERSIHCAVYAARGDVQCVCHPHPLELLPFASSNVPLGSIYHQNVTFYDGIPVFSDLPVESGMLINDMSIARSLAECLGHRRGVLIRDHGVVIVGESIPRTVYSSITLRDNARALLPALAIGMPLKYIGRDEAIEGTRQQFCGLGLPRSWNYWCKNAVSRFPDVAELLTNAERSK